MAARAPNRRPYPCSTNHFARERWSSQTRRSAERLADGIDAKYQESRLIPAAAIDFGFEEIRVDEQVLFIVTGEGAFGKRLIGHRRVEARFAYVCPA